MMISNSISKVTTMGGDIEMAFRQILKSVVREVFDEILQERRFQPHQATAHRKAIQEDERFLLRAKEAAKRLAISERHLFKLTNEGAIPCVRIGRLVHYSTETIQRWIQESESTDAAGPKPEFARRERDATKVKSSSAYKTSESEPKTKRASKKATRKATEFEPERQSSKRQPTKAKAKPEEQRRTGPFDLLLKEIGVDRDTLPPITNGDLMRIAEVDIPTLHGWQWHNRTLPEEALQRLREHFLQFRKG
jgi:excisionase family DNA binding protein